MKKIIILLFLAVGSICNAQDMISFDYDNGGNQTLRKVCFGCPAKTSDSPKEITEIQKEDLIKFFPEDVISYYPNPVKEQLYIKWELTNDTIITSIDLYSLTGQLIRSYKNLERKNNYTISFYDLPDNVYSLRLIYSNGEQKSIKIIKQ